MRRDGTRCEYIPVRSPRPSMASDGPVPAHRKVCGRARADFLLFLAGECCTELIACADGLTGGTVCGRDAARERTGTYLQRVPPVNPSAQARTTPSNTRHENP